MTKSFPCHPSQQTLCLGIRIIFILQNLELVTALVALGSVSGVIALHPKTPSKPFRVHCGVHRSTILPLSLMVH